MHHQTDYALIKLTCRTCRTRDMSDTSRYMAHKAGWTEVETSDQPRNQRIHQWWTHLGFCPACHANNIRRRKENQPVKHNAIKIIVDSAALAAIVVGIAALVLAQPLEAARSAPPPRPSDIGACCYGSGFPVTFSTERWKCETGMDSPSDKPGLFVKGTFDPTGEQSPCNMIPGGD